MGQEIKTCQNCNQSFAIESEDFLFYEKIKVPPPTWCSECRLVRRYAWRNVRSIYKRKCDLCGKDAIGVYSPDKSFKVYCSKCWWSDSWDPMQYGREYDFSKSFFEQFHELIKSVPLPSLYTAYATNVDSDYCNAASSLKNCYLCFRITGGEDSAYLNTIVDGKSSFDCSFLNHSELCYDSVRINKSYQVFYSDNCEDCVKQGTELDALQRKTRMEGNDMIVFTIDINSSELLLAQLCV